MPSPSLLQLLVPIAVCLAPSAALADSPSAAAMQKACHPGQDKQTPGATDYPGGLSAKGGGLTPQTLKGATTVSAAEAKCLLDTFGESVVVLAAVDDERRLPRALAATWIAATGTSAETDKKMEDAFARATGGDKARPIIVYCHHDHCFLSYNGAFRLVEAGYQNVFWMRPGLDGWAKAGFAFEEVKPAKPAIPQGLTERYKNEIAECDKFYFDYDEEKYTLHAVQFDSLAEADGSWAKSIAEEKEDRKRCLTVLKHDFEGNVPALEDLEKRIARTDAEVEKLYRDARANVEANPAKYFGGWFEAQELPKLKSQLAMARTMKTVAEICGRFDYSMPPIDNGIIQARSAARKRHGACLEKLREDSSFTLAEIEFSSAVTLASATERFTCAKNEAPNCLPDSVWRALADVANPKNLRTVKNAAVIWDNRSSEIDDEIDRLNQWIDDVNEMVDRYNAEQ